MIITKKLFQRMERCCTLQNKAREESARIIDELECAKCGNKVKGENATNVVLNLAKHQVSNECFELFVQNELLPRTPCYVSLKSNKTRVNNE